MTSVISGSQLHQRVHVVVPTVPTIINLASRTLSLSESFATPMSAAEAALTNRAQTNKAVECFVVIIESLTSELSDAGARDCVKTQNCFRKSLINFCKSLEMVSCNAVFELFTQSR